MQLRAAEVPCKEEKMAFNIERKKCIELGTFALARTELLIFESCCATWHKSCKDLTEPNRIMTQETVSAKEPANVQEVFPR